MNAIEKRPPVLFNNLGDEPVHRAIRRLRWFKSSFISQVNSVSEQTGIPFETNTEVLARCFLVWLKEFEARKPENSNEYEAFVGFASGLMLRRLIELKPLRHLSIPEPVDKTDPAMFWPEGYVYVMYCLNIRKLVLDEAFSTELEISDVIPDINAWWSFRENVNEMSSYAIAFLDLFAGKQPDFDAPQVFTPGTAGTSRTLPDAANESVTEPASLTSSNPGTTDSSTRPDATQSTSTESQTGTAAAAASISQSTQQPKQNPEPALPLAYGLQIGLTNARAVLVDSNGALLYEQQHDIDFQSGEALQTTHAHLIDGLLDRSHATIQALSSTPEASPTHSYASEANQNPQNLAAATATTNATVQGAFVALPDQLLGNSREIRASLRARMNVPVTVMGTATAAAVAEIALGLSDNSNSTSNRPAANNHSSDEAFTNTAETSFLLIWVESTLETKLVFDGKIVTTTTHNDHAVSAENNANNDTSTQHNQVESEFTDLQNTIGVLHKMANLQRIILAPASARDYSQPLLKRLQLAFPSINTRFSDIPRTPEAFGAVCLQFTDVVRSEHIDSDPD